MSNTENYKSNDLYFILKERPDIYVMRCAIRYYLYNLKYVKNTHGGVFIFTKINTLPWVFFTFFKLYKWYQIAQSTVLTISASVLILTILRQWLQRKKIRRKATNRGNFVQMQDGFTSMFYRFSIACCQKEHLQRNKSI